MRKSAEEGYIFQSLVKLATYECEDDIGLIYFYLKTSPTTGRVHFPCRSLSEICTEFVWSLFKKREKIPFDKLPESIQNNFEELIRKDEASHLPPAPQGKNLYFVRNQFC